MTNTYRKTALVTGASLGIGRATALALAKAGVRVMIHYGRSRGPESLREIVNQLGPGALAASKEEAAACEMVLLAVPWDNVRAKERIMPINGLPSLRVQLSLQWT